MDSPWLIQQLRDYMKNLVRHDKIFPPYQSTHLYAKRQLERLGLGHMGYTLGGLRGAGVTFRYLLGAQVGHLQRHGRWLSARSLEHYLQPAVTTLDTLEWSPLVQNRALALIKHSWIALFASEFPNKS